MVVVVWGCEVEVGYVLMLNDVENVDDYGLKLKEMEWVWGWMLKIDND